MHHKCCAQKENRFSFLLRCWGNKSPINHPVPDHGGGRKKWNWSLNICSTCSSRTWASLVLTSKIWPWKWMFPQFCWCFRDTDSLGNTIWNISCNYAFQKPQITHLWCIRSTRIRRWDFGNPVGSKSMGFLKSFKRGNLESWTEDCK